MSTVCIALLVTPSTRAQGQHPDTVALDGAVHVPLAAQARRAHLLGAVDFYSLALYVEGRMLNRGHLASPEVPKALRIEITYHDALPQRVTLDWRPELVPTLKPAGAAHLRGAFAPLRQGDVVLIEYAPAKGTTVRVNKAVAVSNADHDLMLAFLDHWLGQRPVSEEIKRTLLGAEH